MINFIKNTNMSNQVFVSDVLKQTDVAFAPKYIYTGRQTIESYLCQNKANVIITELESILTSLEIEETQALMLSLDEESKILINFLSHLMLDVKRVILEVPEQDFSEEFYSKLFLLLEEYNSPEREITLITDDNNITSYATNDTHKQKESINLYSQLNCKRSIFKRFIGGKLFILTSLFTGIMIIAAISAVDSHVSNTFTSYLNMPNNIITIHNESTDCSFNESVFDLEEAECESTAPLSYLDIKDMLNNEYVDAIYFDNQYLIDYFNTNISKSDSITASTPDFYFNGLEELETLPCVSDEYTPEMVTCTAYSPDTSLISIATKNDTSALDQNINFNQNSGPDYIFIESNNTNLLLDDLSSDYKNFNLYTSKTIEKYARSSNKSLILRVLVIGTVISFVLAYIVFSILELLGLSPRGLKYMLVYQTHRPFLVNKLYFSAQIGYYLLLNTVGTIITANITHTTTAFTIGIYFGILNSAIWLCFALFSGKEFRHSEDLLRKYIKYTQVLNNKKQLSK